MHNHTTCWTRLTPALCGVFVGLAASVAVAVPPSESPKTPASTKFSDSPAVAPKAGLRKVLPHVRVDIVNKIVEFDGSVPIDVHDAEVDELYLEQIVCTPQTKEHESLVVSKAKASDVHAALLLLGLEPGKPGSWTWKDRKVTRHNPEGPKIEVELCYTNSKGEQVTDTPQAWVVNTKTGKALPDGAWIWGGSTLIENQGKTYYRGDTQGTLVGLATFGTETLGWHTIYSDRSEVEAPSWVANKLRVPAVDTAVVIRLRPVVPNEQESSE